jgi:hypothetical protein
MSGRGDVEQNPMIPILIFPNRRRDIRIIEDQHKTLGLFGNIMKSKWRAYILSITSVKRGDGFFVFKGRA